MGATTSPATDRGSGPHAHAVRRGARAAFALLPGARRRMVLLTLLGTATSLVDAVAISTVVLLLQFAFGTVSTVDGYGALGLLSNLGYRLAEQGPWTIGAVVFAILLVHSTLSALYEGLTSHVRLQAYQTFRERVFDRWVSGAAFATGRREPGTMVNTIQNETWEAADGVYQYCTLAIAGTIAAGYLVILCATSPLLTAIAVLLGLFAVVAVAVLRRRLAHQSQHSIAQKEKLTRHFVSSLHALRTVKAFRAEPAVVQKSLSLSAALRRTFRSIVLLEAALKPITDLVHAVLLFAVLLVAWQLEFPAAIMLGFVAVLYRAQPRFQLVYQTLGRLAKAQPSIAVVAEHLATPAATVVGQGAAGDGADGDGAGGDGAGGDGGDRVFPGLSREIRFEAVSFRYPGTERPVLVDVDLELPRGVFTAVLGRSGAGKSTLVSLLLRFCEPDRGRILCDGVPVRDYSTGSWLRRIAVTGQDVELIDGTIRENLLMGDPAAGEQQLLDALELAGAAEIVHGLPLGLDAEVGSRGVNLSGGQRQRLCLARALLVAADVLVLDEATNAVDAVMELSIYRRIRAARPALTMVVVAHRPAVGRIADRVVVLGDGRTVEAGAPRELLQRPGSVFRELVGPSVDPAEVRSAP